MSAPAARPDTFAAFVEVLARALDDPEVTGEELARRVHLSRFHFDRGITATAGEPPAALRRRVLLERAAYRLVTTRRTVLDVAVEAGYSTHEAFTRAFVRAYGAPPATLGPERLDAPIVVSVEGVDDNPTLRSLLSRLVGQLDMWRSSLAGRDYDFAVERGEGVANLRARLAEAGPAFLSHVREVCEQGRLDESFVVPHVSRRACSPTAG